MAMNEHRGARASADATDDRILNELRGRLAGVEPFVPVRAPGWRGESAAFAATSGMRVRGRVRSVAAPLVLVVAVLVVAVGLGIRQYAATGPISATATATVSAAASVDCAATGGTAGALSFDASFSAMAQLRCLGGSGLVGVILPDVSTSARYTSYDLPYLTRAFQDAGYASSDFKIDNAAGASSTQVTIAQADIAAGARVLVVDPLDGPTGKRIQSLAAAAGIPMISYDRPTFQGDQTYYVSFDSVQIGKLIGQGFLNCVTDWGVTSPKVFTLDGGQDTDPNAIDFARGYNSVVWGQSVADVADGTTNAAGYTLAGEQFAPGWDNIKGQAIFQQAYTANTSINATIAANDGLAGAVIAVLKGAGVQPRRIPTTGQDATLQGMVNTLEGYQCGSVYKPIYLEAQVAVALASYLRAGQTVPAALVNATVTDPTDSAVTEPATLLAPYWVNSANMESTVIKDGFISAADLCAAVGAAVCAAAGIS
jgi:D-xylose transport system substrate-binding protein